MEPARVLVYCPACRASKQEIVCVSVPLELVDEDLFVGLYEIGATASAPEIACDITFGSAPASLVERVSKALAKRTAAERSR